MMGRFFASTTLVLVLVSAGRAFASDAAVPAAELAVLEFGSVRRLCQALAEHRDSADEGRRAAFWADVSLLAGAVVGDGAGDALALDPTAARTPRVRLTTDMLRRDNAAYQLLSLGYSARETADVIGGRISRGALDMAHRMLMAGQGREAAANYLDAQYARIARLRAPAAPAAVVARRAPSTRFDAAIDRYASLHRIDPALVRAIISAESAFDPRARSRAGALGLMQLMPATARALAVDPLVPEQNIEGGIRYFAELLAMFGRVDLALVAYNGGPGYARRYLRGETALYGETREYVRRVLSRFGLR
jgi:soluble lytic murein transglycosylase-like protein